MSSKEEGKEENDLSTPLNRYKRKRKTLTPPLANIPNITFSSWTNDRMPDMLWAVLIREHFSDDSVYIVFKDILNWLEAHKGTSNINGVTHINIAKFDRKLRNEFIKYIVMRVGIVVLQPLLLFPDLPAYGDWKNALADQKLNQVDAYNQLARAVSKVMFHQTQEATDVRWVKLLGAIISTKLHLPTEMVAKYLAYPNDYDQRMVRASIRSSEMALETLGPKHNEWPAKFWEHLHENTHCIPEVQLTKDLLQKRYDKEVSEKAYFNERLPAIRNQLVNHTLVTATSTGINSRHEIVFGLALYATDTFIENTILLVGGTPSGRINARVIFESFVTLKYLLTKEKQGEPLWDTYREYGIGQLSLIDRKYKESALSSSMVDSENIEDLVNEDKWQEYTPINLGHWDDSNLRVISEEIGEKALYDKYYQYTSGFIHASWGAIREVSFQKCLNPLHRYHRIPHFELPVLKGANEDCRQMINDIFNLVNDAFPGFEASLEKNPATENIEPSKTAQ